MLDLFVYQKFTVWGGMNGFMIGVFYLLMSVFVKVRTWNRFIYFIFITLSLHLLLPKKPLHLFSTEKNLAKAKDKIYWCDTSKSSSKEPFVIVNTCMLKTENWADGPEVEPIKEKYIYSALLFLIHTHNKANLSNFHFFLTDYGAWIYVVTRMFQ